MTVTNPTLLDVSDLGVSVAEQPVVTRAEFLLEPGGSLGIVGETGSGKSMTCRALTGLLSRMGGRITGGKVTFAGTDVTHNSHADWAALRGSSIAFVPQNSLNGLDPVMKVGRQLEETLRALRPADDPAHASRDLLEQVGMPRVADVLRSYPHELSGGMRQRVMIALAIAGRPRLLIADEPTTALDVVIERQILALLSELQEEHEMGLLIVSHDFDVIEAVADQIAVMYAGMTVERGAASAVLEQPIHPYTQALLAARPSSTTRRRLTEIAGHPPAPDNWATGCRFAPRCPFVEDRCTAEIPAMRGTNRQAAACIRAEGSSG